MTRNLSSVTRSTRTARLAALGVGAVVGILGVAGCSAEAPEATPSATVTVTAPASPSASTPSPEATPLSIPDCQTLVPLDVVQSQPSWSGFAFIGQYDDAAEAVAVPGPLAAEVAEGASSRRDCLWGVPSSDNAVAVHVLTIEQADQDRLVAALEGAPEEYTGSEISGATAFSTQAPVGIGEGTIVYAFEDGAWIIMSGHDDDPAVASAVIGTALESIRAANR